MMVNQVLFTKIREIINKHDPIKLISIGCPEDEYDLEVRLILKGLSRCKSIDEINNLVYSTFVEMFGESYAIKIKNIKKDFSFVGKKADYKLITREIYLFIRKNIMA